MFYAMKSNLSFPFSFSCILFLFLFVQPAFSHFQYPHLQPNELLNNSAHPSPFEFLKNMQGCRKGEKVKGIRDLKLYLSHFGYLNYQNNPNITNPKEDHFGEDLEEAIKSYQVYYHLNATGTLDEPTVSKMVMPRCGFPDKETHQHSDKSLHTVSHYRFFPGRPKWPKGKRHLTYAFGSRFPTRFMPPVTRAFKRWATASRYFTFSRARTYRSADLKISFARRAHGDGAPFDGPGGVLAHAFAPTDGRLHYDADDRWVVGAVRNAYDVETLALHEIGHLLGLGHSQFPKAIMWPTFRAGVTKGLNSDDIRGLRALYSI
ncbi:putative matrilysin [Helianthus annuus]|uniref:Matrilysin n=2 Tax=Helianthus annuus TaxID=4232 RepID=A0A251SX24_HELAN|nr:putative matrilysin [Helianthus annuus]KAJ0499603.1 putative matrilysin [Helianthus annuus]KAJ0665615.1 putative matrilysin [Helianthus annuus]